jgi:hypothetical protein
VTDFSGCSVGRGNVNCNEGIRAVRGNSHEIEMGTSTVDRLGLLRRMEDSGQRLRLLRLLASRKDVDVKGLKIGNWSFVILSNEVTT